MPNQQDPDIMTLTAQIVSAHVSKNKIASEALPSLIRGVFQSLASAGTVEPPAAELVPAVPIKRSVFPDYIVCLEDGKRLKMLKRHLQSSYGLTPDAYRAKWKLASDYPMVAPNYASQRSALAKKIGLGRKPVEPPPPPREAPGGPSPQSTLT